MTSIGKDGPKNLPAEQEPPEPKDFPTWYENAWKELQEWYRDREHKKLSKHLADEHRLGKAHEAIHRAAETRRFIEGEFWKKFLQPALSEGKTLKAWTPGDPLELEKIASAHLFASGKAWMAAAILEKFKEWTRIGDEAKKFVAADSERRKQLAEIGK